MGAKYCDECVRPFTHLKNYNSLFMLPMAVAWSSSGGVARDTYFRFADNVTFTKTICAWRALPLRQNFTRIFEY